VVVLHVTPAWNAASQHQSIMAECNNCHDSTMPFRKSWPRASYCGTIMLDYLPCQSALHSMARLRRAT
jgi:hypothetical protein